MINNNNQIRFIPGNVLIETDKAYYFEMDNNVTADCKTELWLPKGECCYIENKKRMRISMSILKQKRILKSVIR